MRHYTKPTEQIKKRLEYLRQELALERISYGELAELQSLSDYIEPGDVELLEPAGVPEEEADQEQRLNYLRDKERVAGLDKLERYELQELEEATS